VTPLMNVLLPVVVGGVIGILGGFVGPYFIQRAKDVADKKRKRAEKFEELVGAVVEHGHWIKTLRSFKTYGIGSEPTLTPIVKIRAISATYFPEFEKLVLQLDLASHKYERWMVDTALKRLQDEPESGHDDISKEYIEKREALVTELRSFARREFQ
jgi:hypothetical protein